MNLYSLSIKNYIQDESKSEEESPIEINQDFTSPKISMQSISEDLEQKNQLTQKNLTIQQAQHIQAYDSNSSLSQPPVMSNSKTAHFNQQQETESLQNINYQYQIQSDGQISFEMQNQEKETLLIRTALIISEEYYMVSVFKYININHGPLELSEDLQPQEGLKIYAKQKNQNELKLKVSKTLPTSELELDQLIYTILQKLKVQMDNQNQKQLIISEEFPIVKQKQEIEKVLYRKGHYINDRYMRVSVIQNEKQDMKIQAFDALKNQTLELTLNFDLRNMQYEYITEQLEKVINCLTIENVFQQDILMLSKS